jgi:thiol-disulfide isomerase/thioredoxin
MSILCSVFNGNGKIIVPILLLLPGFLSAQQNIADLKVGDPAPALSVYRWVKGNPVSAFEKGKTYVVEFGATWCAPCAAAIPHLTDLAVNHRKDLTVISVFVMEYRKNPTDTAYLPMVDRYVKNRDSQIQYTVAVDGPDKKTENDWLTASESLGIPKLFVIDKNGLIAWMGNPNPEQVNMVVDLVNDPTYDIQDAVQASIADNIRPSPIDPRKPLFINGNGDNGNDFLYRSLLTKFHGEKTLGLFEYVYTATWAKYNSHDQPYAGMVLQVGVPIAKLYYMAYADTMGYMVPSRYVDGTPNYPDTVKDPTLSSSYGKYWYKAILQVKDSSPFQFNYRSRANSYNYNLIVPDDKATARYLQETMRRDLQTYFGYKVVVKDSLMPYWRLSAGSSARELLKAQYPDSAFSEFQRPDSAYHYRSAIMKDILIRLIFSYSFGQSSYGIDPKEEAPFIDETGIKGPIDYDLSIDAWRGMEKNDWNTYIKFLERYDLHLEKSKRVTRVVIIRDPA